MMNITSDDGAVYDGYGEADEEYEIEEMVDDEPMHMSGRLFLGSIDASRNGAALSKARIAFTLALLGADDHGGGITAVLPLESSSDPRKVTQHSVTSSDEALAGITRTEIAIEDALDESLLQKLPTILATLNSILCVHLCVLAVYHSHSSYHLLESSGDCSTSSILTSTARVSSCSEEAERVDKNVLVHW